MSSTPAPHRRETVRNAASWITRWRHPFWWLPDVPSEQDEMYRNIWSSLRQLPSVEPTGVPTEGPGDLVTLGVTIPESALEPAFGDLTDDLAALPFVRPTPGSDAVITVQELGYLQSTSSGREDITDDWIEEFIAQTERPLTGFQPFSVRLGGVNSYADAMILDVHDDGWISRMHTRVLDFVSQPPNRKYAFLPECVIAEYTDTGSIDELLPVLMPYRDVTFAQCEVIDVELLRHPRGAVSVQPEVLHRFELGRVPGFIDRVDQATPSNPVAVP